MMNAFNTIAMPPPIAVSANRPAPQPMLPCDSAYTRSPVTETSVPSSAYACSRTLTTRPTTISSPTITGRGALTRFSLAAASSVPRTMPTRAPPVARNEPATVGCIPFRAPKTANRGAASPIALPANQAIAAAIPVLTMRVPGHPTRSSRRANARTVPRGHAAVAGISLALAMPQARSLRPDVAWTRSSLGGREAIPSAHVVHAAEEHYAQRSTCRGTNARADYSWPNLYAANVCGLHPNRPQAGRLRFQRVFIEHHEVR